MHTRVAAILAAFLIAAGCTGGNSSLGRPEPGGPDTTGTTSSLAPADRPRGGSVSVRMYGEPDVTAATLSGAAVRQLVHPQLFSANPEGQWEPLLVEPGSDTLAGDQRSASFRFRDAVKWSDGSAITASDLERTADARFVESVAEVDGLITATFTQALPGWRRLWSGVDSITPPEFGVWGGPFVLQEYTEGLESVLVRNNQWWDEGPFIDELRLVLVPSSTIALQLFERAEIDVLSMLAHTNRTKDLQAVEGASVSLETDSGWWVGLEANPDVNAGQRAALLASVDRDLFVGTLMKGEAEVIAGFHGAEVWVEALVADPSAAGAGPFTVLGIGEEPNTSLVGRAMQRVIHPAGGRLELVNPEADIAEPMIDAGDFDVAVTLNFDSPDICWRCRWEGVDAALPRAADSETPGAAARLQQRLREDALMVPLWTSYASVGAHARVNGVRANGWALSAAWNAADWWVTE